MQKIKTAEEVIRSLHEREPDSKATDYQSELIKHGIKISVVTIGRKLKEYGIDSRPVAVRKAAFAILDHLNVSASELQRLLKDKGYDRGIKQINDLIQRHKTEKDKGAPLPDPREKQIKQLIVRCIGKYPNASDTFTRQFLRENGISMTTDKVASYRSKLSIGNALKRRENIFFSYMDDHPGASAQDLWSHMWDRGFANFSQASTYEYMAKYKKVKAERLKEKAL